MKQFLYILLNLHFIINSSLCLSQVVQEWQASYIGPGNGDFLNYMVIDANGNVYVTGSSRNTINSCDFATVKYSTSGTELWSARYGGLQYIGAIAYSVAADRFGNTYVTGCAPLSGGNGLSKYTTIKYNQSGEQCWIKIYYGTWYSASNTPYSIVTDFDANVYVTGGSYFDETAYDYTTIKYDSSGNELWVARYWNYGQDWGKHIAVDNSGNVYVTGYSSSSAVYDDDIVTIKYDSSGIEQWVARYSGMVNRGDSVNALAVDDSGNVYVTGFSWGGDSTGQDYVTIKYNSVGRTQWVARYNGSGNWTDIAHSLAVDDSGNVYVTGESNISNHIYYATIKYSPSGEQQWITTYSYQNEGDVARSISVDNKGGIYVTGQSWTGIFGTRHDFATIKYNTSGEQQWVVRTTATGNEVPVKIAVDSTGNVYVAGNSGHYLTIKYNQLTGISPIANELPNEYKLYQNCPNPFNPMTKLRFNLKQSSNTKLVVYNILGKEITTLVNENLSPGSYVVDWDGSAYPSGIYFYKIEAATFSDVKLMILIK